MTQRNSDKSYLSRLYHLNSEPFADDQPPAPYAQKTKTYQDAPRLRLPAAMPGPVERLAAARRSHRNWADKPLDMTSLALLLRAGYGALGPQALEDGQLVLRRPVPSAGALYPLEVYALVRDVSGLDAGIYHFDAVGDALALLSAGPIAASGPAAFASTWPFAANAPVILCLSAVFDRVQSKYGERGYRFALIEAGHVAQNICLAAEYMGLGSLNMGGFSDRHLNRLLGLDGEAEAALYTIGLGHKGSL